MTQGPVYIGTGRRKTSVARVRLKRGTGAVKINNRDMEAYFPVERERAAVLAPLKATKMLGKYDVTAMVSGGAGSPPPTPPPTPPAPARGKGPHGS